MDFREVTGFYLMLVKWYASVNKSTSSGPERYFYLEIDLISYLLLLNNKITKILMSNNIMKPKGIENLASFTVALFKTNLQELSF